MSRLKVSTQKAPIVVALAILVIIISVISILRMGSEPTIKKFDNAFVEFGRIAAEKTGEYLGPGARVVLLIHDEQTVEDAFVEHMSSRLHEFPQPMSQCNMEWQTATMERYCNDEEAFNSATLGEVMNTQRWPMVTEQDRGIATLW